MFERLLEVAGIVLRVNQFKLEEEAHLNEVLLWLAIISVLVQGNAHWSVTQHSIFKVNKQNISVRLSQQTVGSIASADGKNFCNFLAQILL